MFPKHRIWFGGILVSLITAEAAADGCTVTDIPSLQLCVEQLSSYNSIEINNDLTCSASSCCGPNGTALLSIANQSDKFLNGSGAVGVYVGQYRSGLPSKHVRIMDSIFAHTRANAIAIEGALPGDADAPNQISGNIFLKNHWYGLWPVPGGGITTGGQLLINATDNIQVINNIIADGYCENCSPNPTVTGIEIGTGTNQEKTSRLTIIGNYFYNLSATAIRVNPGSTVLNATFTPDN